MRGAIIGLGVAAGALVVYMLGNLVPASGAFASLEPMLVDRCARLDIAPGTEDVTIDPDTGLAFVSTTDRRKLFAGQPVRGAIYIFDPASRGPAHEISPPAPADFQPHGISLWRGADGQKRLFVVNHPSAGGHTVEIFDVGQNGDLAHVETIAFDALGSPNDIVAVGPRQFYATNDRRFSGGALATLEAWLALPLSNAVYFDGESGRVAAGALTYANGINVSADGSTIYIAELLRRRIGLYERNAETGALRRRSAIRVPTAPDNIEVARDGALWVAGHTKIFDFLKHVDDPNAIAPSHVLRVNPRNGNISDAFVDTTGAINAASVGAVWDTTLIVGAVFDGHVMVCPMLEIFLRGQTE